MTKRMFEYDVQIALEDGITSKMGLEVNIPKSAVIYYISLIKDSILALAEAAKRLGMSEEEMRKYM